MAMSAVFGNTITDAQIDELLADTASPHHSAVVAHVQMARKERSPLLISMAKERLAEIYNQRLFEQRPTLPTILLGHDQNTINTKGGSNGR